jgi:hypothetical protein
MGWLTGFEPATARSTIWGSNHAELQPPSGTEASWGCPRRQWETSGRQQWHFGFLTLDLRFELGEIRSRDSADCAFENEGKGNEGGPGRRERNRIRLYGSVPAITMRTS